MMVGYRKANRSVNYYVFYLKESQPLTVSGL